MEVIKGSFSLNRLPSANNRSYRRPQKRYQSRQNFAFKHQNYIQPNWITMITDRNSISNEEQLEHNE